MRRRQLVAVMVVGLVTATLTAPYAEAVRSPTAGGSEILAGTWTYDGDRAYTSDEDAIGNRNLSGRVQTHVVMKMRLSQDTNGTWVDAGTTWTASLSESGESDSTPEGFGTCHAKTAVTLTGTTGRLAGFQDQVHLGYDPAQQVGTKVRLWAVAHGDAHLVRKWTPLPGGSSNCAPDEDRTVPGWQIAATEGCPGPAVGVQGTVVAGSGGTKALNMACSGSYDVTGAFNYKAHVIVSSSGSLAPACAPASASPAAGECNPVAEAGGPYSTMRATPVTLDGSGSKGDITSYTWSFTPGINCPSGTALRTAAKTGAKVPVTPLCNLIATLRVKDGQGRSATDTAVVLAKARAFDPASISHTEQPLLPVGLDPRTPQRGIIPPATVGGPPSGVAALNVSKCSKDVVSILCPFLKWPYGGKRSRLDHGYTLAKVADPGGPFDGFFYVDTATMSIDRIALFNPWLVPFGPAGKGAKANFYIYNHTLGTTVDTYLDRVRDHEGEGLAGAPLTGHTGALRAKVASSPENFDPNRSLEDLWAPSKTSAQALVDVFLSALEQDLKQATADPLPPIWGGGLEFWAGARSGWVTGAITVGGF